MPYLIVFLGAGIGGTLRHGVNQLALRFAGAGFPFGTLVINILGCFAMGITVSVFALRGSLSPDLRLFLTTGVLGGFTTFSAFSLDAALLWERGEMGLAALYVTGSVVLSLTAVAAGMIVTRYVLAASGA